ncbi:hypothetical protein GCM10009775_17500 [Microbacterium aoyamense]|uniref:DUF2332 domain-containing protein n=1 Tax=Microbacterium aoyamense TaxID=344166 RepID=A0ABN2PNA7_9MICO|nr:DUF2332 domain-containing protein [Microbacterium aoyamense]
MDAATLDRVRAYYDDFGRRWASGTSPLYEEWALGIAADDDLITRIAGLDQRLRQANLLFASARWLGCPLVPFPEWSTWLRAHWDDVVAVAGSRSTQTNEPNRCATLLPVLSRIAGPVALLEVGASAGLCLFPDRYSTLYETPSGSTRLDPVTGPTEFALACRIDEDPPTRMPDVVWRRGIDLNPLDPTDQDAIDWLATLVWPGPDHDARAERLRGAAAVAAADPPRIVRGDLLDLVAEVAASAPADATLVVFHSAVLLYLDAAQRRRFADLVSTIPCVWLSNESTGTLPEFDAQVPDDLDTSHRFVQTVDGRAVALVGGHGAVYETLPFRS